MGALLDLPYVSFRPIGWMPYRARGRAHRIYKGIRGWFCGAGCAKYSKEGRMIRKTKSGYKVLSEKGKNLGGPYKSKGAAQKRLRQVEFFKRRNG
jgi:hypothetical protein